ncbi:hypothetical protein EB810_06390 [Altererythrobacter sp. FM1]|uniref:hypothetical protein n=1 Tax=Tsuneonella flava TaxID=2055955 RepID=UPI000C8081A5|nr:hypothetical protein [Tsuneonella flava]ROT94788.1 hypothetical protein EB810_06390 [Altererythrobacter sp. FM1]
MIASLLTILFAASATFAALILIDGFLRGRSAWHRLHAELKTADAWQVAVVRLEQQVQIDLNNQSTQPVRAIMGNTGRMVRRGTRVIRQTQHRAAA